MLAGYHLAVSTLRPLDFVANPKLAWKELEGALDMSDASSANPGSVATNPPNPSTAPTIPPTDGQPVFSQDTPFVIQIGSADAEGWLSFEQRRQRLQLGENPYVFGPSLAADSPVFFGREVLRRQICAKLRADKPGCVSLLGERRIGKSSLLNQVVRTLATCPGLLTLETSAQQWSAVIRANFSEIYSGPSSIGSHWRSIGPTAVTVP